MQSSVWGMSKDKIACSDTFFTSEFFDFNQESSQMEDFDISKQYLNSQLSQKSAILRHMSQQYFTQALQIYFKFCLRDSLLFWRKLNEKEKRKQALSPKNMTKVFLKVFYILNKKSRSKVQKAFVKITNFTKQHEMKTYQTPIVKGIKKLCDTFESLNAKYCYGNPIYALNLIEYGFKEFKLLSKVVQNKQLLVKFMKLLEKMSNHVALQQFGEKLISYEKLNDKMEIFFGTLSLLVNPLKRSFFQKLKQSKFTSNFILHELDESIKQLEPQSITKDLSSLTNKQLVQNPVLNTQNICFKKTTDLVSFQIQALPLIQNLQQKRISSSASDDYFSQSSQNYHAEGSQASQAKGSLTFSRQLKRKSSSSLEKKNKFKFKSIPAGTPKKQPKEQYIQKHLQAKTVNNTSDLQYGPTKNNLSQTSNQRHIKPNKSRIDLNFLIMNSKPLQVKMNFQNSLNYASKTKRMITTNQKISFTNPHKPNEFNSSYPDYFDFYSFTDIPLDKKLKQAQTNLKSKQDHKKGFKIFKTIKSGKSNTNFDQVPYPTPKKQPQNKNHPPKLSFQIPSSQILQAKGLQNNNYQNIPTQRSKMEPFLLIERQNMKTGKNHQISTQKLLNFKSLERAASNSSLHDLKHEYKFPISYQSNKNVESLPYYDTMRQKNNYMNEYLTNPYQPNQNEQNLRQNRIQKPYEPTKNSSLTFKTNRPMKKIKSADKQIVIKTIHSKKDKKGQKPNNIKSKKPKQIKSEFIDQKEEVPNLHYKLENTTLLTARSGKSVSQKNLLKNIGLKLNSKK